MTTLALIVAVAAAAPPETALPVGDGRVSTSAPAQGSVYACRGGNPNAPGAQRQGPWFNGDGTFNLREKVTVDGAVSWAQARTTMVVRGGRRLIKTNGVPRRTRTGIFPIARSDDAYQYDRNPNAIGAQGTTYVLPANPRRARRATCLPGGPIGVTTDGVAIFNALDARGNDAVAHEVQDACGGHPEMRGTYHVHSIPACLTRGDAANRHSGVVGYALDGFAIFGPRGNDGTVLSNADLDACHGHTHAVRPRGRRQRTFHYHATREYPYSLGCLRGTPRDRTGA